MGIANRIKLWWNSKTPTEKFDAVFRMITSGVICAAGGCCLYEAHKCRKTVDFAVNKIGDDLDVEVSQELIDAAVTKATNAQIARTVKAAVDRDWRDIQEETKKKVGEAVAEDRKKISEAVAETLAHECEKTSKADILSDIKEKAKETLAEKLDSKLDDITDEYSRNLSNMGKVYEALADKLNSKA